jgi:hypothetical protein
MTDQDGAVVLEGSVDVHAAPGIIAPRCESFAGSRKDEAYYVDRNTAKTLRLTIPQTLLLRADQVIE